MDEDSSQTSKAALEALNSIETKLLRMLLGHRTYILLICSHLVTRPFKDEAKAKCIEAESVFKSQDRVVKAIKKQTI